MNSFVCEWKRIKDNWNKILDQAKEKNMSMFKNSHRLDYFKKIMNNIHITKTIDDLIIFGIIDYEPLERMKIQHYINFIRAIISKIDDRVIENIDYLRYAQSNFIYDGSNVYNTDIYHINHENYYGINDNAYLKLFDLKQCMLELYTPKQ